MADMQSESFGEFLNSAIGLASAFVLGTLIGAERQYRQRTAGLRTNVLVAIGASAFVDIGMRLTGSAGVIMKEGMNIRGLNTAATLWCSAAVGAFAGTRLIGEAALLTVAVLAGNTLLRPLINLINRTPIDERRTEATYEVRVTTQAENVVPARDLLVETLEAANYPVSDVDVEERTEDDVEIVATLVSTAVEPAEIETVIRLLKAAPMIRGASWTVRTSD
jgi:putative Mg2+ transporter-C (MgtC) family protein